MKVAVAMSGGVDSSTVALMIKEQGYEVIGITMNLGRFCDSNAITDAEQVAEKLEIPHYTLDVSREFEQEVINYFVHTYLSGKTPNPCAMCNHKIKFGRLLEYAKELGCDKMATGHYAKVVNEGVNIELHKGVDEIKDQSYFLARLTKEQLSHIMFPLEGLVKEKVREYARKLDMKISEKAESQDICFVQNINYTDLIEQKARELGLELRGEGEIVDLDGKVLGKHKGLIHYTIGQRKGLGIAYPEPLYVYKLDAENNRVIVSTKPNLSDNKVNIMSINWLSGEAIDYEKTYEFDIRLRSTQRPQSGSVKFNIDGSAEVKLYEKIWGVTAGQLCVFYDSDRVVGSGWIV